VKTYPDFLIFSTQISKYFVSRIEFYWSPSERKSSMNGFTQARLLVYFLSVLLCCYQPIYSDKREARSWRRRWSRNTDTVYWRLQAAKWFTLFSVSPRKIFYMRVRVLYLPTPGTFYRNSKGFIHLL